MTHYREWTPARTFLAIAAVYHLVLGGIGFVLNQTFPATAAEAASAHSDHIFGIFETNGWHSSAAVFLGVVALYFALRPRYAREAALWIGISNVGVFLAFAFFEPTTFRFASNGADQVIHFLTGVGGIVAALATSAETYDRRGMQDATARA